MGKITFILGGARSGKSQFAIKLSKERAKKVAFITTGLASDSEMKKRIGQHKKTRPKTWSTFEEPGDILGRLKKIDSKFELIIIDCLTLLVSNLILKGLKENLIYKKIDRVLNMLKKFKANSIIVSNEVGLGIVPQNKLARNFRDIAGRTNQKVAIKSDEVFFLVAGLAWRIK